MPGFGRDRRLGIEDRRLHVEHLEDAARGAGGLLGQGEQPAERDDRPDQLQVQGQEGDQLAQRHRVVRDGDHAAPGDAGQDHLRHALEQRPEEAEGAQLLELGAAQALRVAGEPGQHVRAAAVGLDHADAQRRLLDRGGEVAGEILRVACFAAVAQLEAAGEHRERGQRDEHEQAELEIDVDQQDDHHDGDAGVRDQEHEAEADEAPQRRQVGGQA